MRRAIFLHWPKCGRPWLVVAVLSVAALVPLIKVEAQIKDINCNTGIGHAVRFKLPPNSCFGCVYQLSNGIRLGVVGTPTCIRWMIVEKPAAASPVPVPNIPNGVILSKP